MLAFASATVCAATALQCYLAVRLDFYLVPSVYSTVSCVAALSEA